MKGLSWWVSYHYSTLTISHVIHHYIILFIGFYGYFDKHIGLEITCIDACRHRGFILRYLYMYIDATLEIGEK